MSKLVSRMFDRGFSRMTCFGIVLAIGFSEPSFAIFAFIADVSCAVVDEVLEGVM